VIAALSLIHLYLLHLYGSGNPLGINSKIDTLPFYPYSYIKDVHSYMVFFLVFVFIIFFIPNLLGHSDNYIEANPLVTPTHIVPEWYFLPFYAILRSIPDKLVGVLAMIGSIIV
jgi:quinol-cytochrome oxidoreductase complex cytochrome b subunit